MDRYALAVSAVERNLKHALAQQDANTMDVFICSCGCMITCVANLAN